MPSKLMTDYPSLQFPAKSAKLWSFIYSYINRRRYADTLDDRFMSEIERRFPGTSRATVSRQLNNMASRGIIQKWIGTVQKGLITAGSIFLRGNEPTRTARYTMIGKEPPNTMYRRKNKDG